jgi:chromosome segregation ATPase
MLNITDSFEKLKFEFDRQQANLKALETECRAAGQRLDDNLRREAEASAALKKVLSELADARQDLTEAQRAADKVRAQAATDVTRLRQDAQNQAETFLQNVEATIAAIRRKPAA